ncbi:MAG: tetratricopeptide (TPR) repeat protein [Myxococcota bacterium]|jgi:tetratricopeptide (TPR) repeat protein
MSSNLLMNCRDFEMLLSSMLDSELNDGRTSSAMMHLEHCPDCTEFFGAIRLQALAHTELDLSGFKVSECSIEAAKGFFGDYDDAEIVRRLARALYQLGKAYTLMAASEDNYLLSVSEAPVDVEHFSSTEASSALAEAQLAGTENCDGIELPNGKKHSLAKAKNLLEQCLTLKPQYSEATLYLGQVFMHLDNSEAALARFESVFKGSDRLVMRVHAAIQIAMVFDLQKQHQSALRYYRWVVASGILQQDATFGIVFHNIAVQHGKLNNKEYAQNALSLYRKYDVEGWQQSLEMLGQN